MRLLMVLLLLLLVPCVCQAGEEGDGVEAASVVRPHVHGTWGLQPQPLPYGLPAPWWGREEVWLGTALTVALVGLLALVACRGAGRSSGPPGGPRRRGPHARRH